MEHLQIYTDGGCNPNPGIGRFAFIVVKKNKIITHYQSPLSNKVTTNNRMEMLAIIYAIKYLKKNNINSCDIFSDSRLCISIYNDWMFKWRNKKWKRGNKPIKNLDLILMLYDLYNSNYKLNWVKGHSDNVFNNYVDKLTNI